MESIGAREMWRVFEPVHAVVYYTPEARGAFEAAGLRGFWRGYFAGRAAPLGEVGPATVIALFSSFSPQMVHRAIPDVWSRATPGATLDARVTGAAAALRTLAGSDRDHDVAEAADLAERAVGLAPTSGRALAAANAALPPPADPWGRLWQATTTLREHRGDGHVAALVAAGLGGRRGLVLKAALEGYPAINGPARGWSDEEWAETVGSLADNGYLAADGTPTEAGRAAYQAVEDTTDRLGDEVWQALGAAETRRLADLLRPLARASGALMPYPNPIGLPPPD